MSTSPSSVVVSPGISSGVMSAGPTGVFYLGHPGTPIPVPLPLVALAPLPPGGQLNPPVAGSNPSSPVVHGAGAPAVAGAGSGSSAPVRVVLPKPIAEMTDLERFNLGMCTQDSLRAIKGGGGSRFTKPSSLSSPTTSVRFERKDGKEGMDEVTHHHMIPIEGILEIWSGLRKAYLESFEGVGPQPYLSSALLALIQLSGVLTAAVSEADFFEKRRGQKVTEDDLMRARANLLKVQFDQDPESPIPAFKYLQKMDSGEMTTHLWNSFFASLTWMGFNLIRGPHPLSRSDDPGSDFDAFEDSVGRVLTEQKRNSGLFSEKARNELSVLKDRIKLVSELYSYHCAYTGSCDLVSTALPRELRRGIKNRIKREQTDDLNKKLQILCDKVGEIRTFVSQSAFLQKDAESDTSFRINPEDGTPAFAVPVKRYAVSLTLSTFTEFLLWEQNPDGIWAKRKKLADSESPSSSGMVSPRR